MSILAQPSLVELEPIRLSVIAQGQMSTTIGREGRDPLCRHRCVSIPSHFRLRAEVCIHSLLVDHHEAAESQHRLIEPDAARFAEMDTLNSARAGIPVTVQRRFDVYADVSKVAA